MISRNNPTLLTLSGVGVPPYSARGITQTLEYISASVQLKRTVNGILRDLSDSQFRKLKSTISCTDHDPPAVDGVWPGQEIIVECVAELCYATLGGSPSRTPVDYSLRTSGDFTFYRPELTMLVAGPIRISKAEWPADVSWSLDLEEA